GCVFYSRPSWPPGVTRGLALSSSIVATEATKGPQASTPGVGPGGETVVMKFGGTSVAGPEDLKRAAARIVAERQRGNKVVAVLSARGKTTDELLTMAGEISDSPSPREMDMLLSTGERISCALCAMAIWDLGHQAISLTGSQAGGGTPLSPPQA